MWTHALLQDQRSFDDHAIRCVLAHDHVLLRQGLRRLLEDEPDMEVIGEASNASQALDLVSEHLPEIVIADANFFDCAADQAELMIRQKSPGSRLLYLTTNEAKETPLSGADAATCAVRQTSAAELVGMVRRTHAAQKHTVMRELTERRELGWPGVELQPRKRVLTDREREVLKLLAEGQTVRSAAGILGLSSKTVDAHKFNLMRKLGIHNKAELVMWAIQKRVVKLPANF